MTSRLMVAFHWSTTGGSRTARRALEVCGLIAVLANSGCSGGDTLGFDFDLTRGPSGWTPGFADYPAADEEIYGLEADFRPLPPPLDSSRSALYIAGTNRSDDLWMYYKTQGFLEPNTAYRVAFEVEIATAVPSGCAGVGGAPGEGVTVKAGVSLAEPDRFLDGQGIWRMTVDKGQQTNGGVDAVALGDLANSRACEEGFGWELKALSSGTGAMTISTDDSGSVWLFVGTDSGFESRSAIYITRVVALFDRG